MLIKTVVASALYRHQATGNKQATFNFNQCPVSHPQRSSILQNHTQCSLTSSLEEKEYIKGEIWLCFNRSQIFQTFTLKIYIKYIFFFFFVKITLALFVFRNIRNKHLGNIAPLATDCSWLLSTISDSKQWKVGQTQMVQTCYIQYLFCY